MLVCRSKMVAQWFHACFMQTLKQFLFTFTCTFIYSSIQLRTEIFNGIEILALRWARQHFNLLVSQIVLNDSCCVFGVVIMLKYEVISMNRIKIWRDIWVLLHSFRDLERSATLGHTSEGLHSLVGSLIKYRFSRTLVFRGRPDLYVLSPLKSSNKRLQSFLAKNNWVTLRALHQARRDPKICLFLAVFFLAFSFRSCFFDSIFHNDYDP